MTNEISGDLIQTSFASINKQVKDILRITGENEVIQSFVRSDATIDLDETSKESKSAKEKKIVDFGWKPSEISFATAITEKNKETKEDADAKQFSQIYQQLGKDAQFNHKSTISKKTGNKWNKRQRLIEEVYTDKDRAAAVNLGSKDIKQSLKLKRRQDRTRILEISEEVHPGTLLALAIHRFKTGDVYVAMKFVNKALELNPYDKNALVARSKCHLQMGNAQSALDDAEQALAEEKCCIKALYQKAESLYHLARFEYSLMYFHRGLHIRPQMENFKQGVHKAQQAINNTIGKTVPYFEKFYPPKCSIRSRRTTTNGDLSLTVRNNTRICDTKLLKELHTDKIYLEKLINNPNIIYVNGNNRDDNKILDEAKEGVQFLQSRQHFWRQQQAFKHVKATKSKKKVAGAEQKY